MILVSNRCLKLSWQTCLCLGSSENKQTSEGIRRRKPLSTRTINQLCLLLCMLVLGVEPIAGFVWHQRHWLGRLQLCPSPSPSPGLRKEAERWDAWDGRGLEGHGCNISPPAHRTTCQIIITIVRDIF